ncbi:MAG: MBL fold metallo-hydrolase [Burkholderiaceae bacterium]|nr:MAG: MBL fold metallo-hydrolase [Burkholderiaceae bacterium]
MVFRQLFDPQSSTYTYLLGDEKSREAILIDPVFEQARRDAALIHELDLKLIATLETHIHADHVTSAWLLKQQLGNRIALSKSSGAEGADITLQHGDRLAFGKRYVSARATPGHTNGCLSYVLDDESMAFTGDCLLIRGSGRTDFQQGDPHQLYRSVRTQLFTLPERCLLFPAHDYRGLTVTSVGEEKRFNPRLGGEIGEDDFAGYMDNLNLPHPRQIDSALPANLRCGRREGDFDVVDTPQWAQLTYTFAGIWVLPPHAYEDVASKVQLIDVREADEYLGPLGHIHNATLIPLGELSGRINELDRTRPIVTVCRSGGRSAQAVVLLQKAGFKEVANLAGGMLLWHASGYSVEGGE